MNEPAETIDIPLEDSFGTFLRVSLIRDDEEQPCGVYVAEHDEDTNDEGDDEAYAEIEIPLDALGAIGSFVRSFQSEAS